MRICVVAPPGECLRVKANMVLFAGNTVCAPYLSGLEAFADKRYTNRHYKRFALKSYNSLQSGLVYLKNLANKDFSSTTGKPAVGAEVWAIRS